MTGFLVGNVAIDPAKPASGRFGKVYMAKRKGYQRAARMILAIAIKRLFIPRREQASHQKNRISFLTMTHNSRRRLPPRRRPKCSGISDCRRNRPGYNPALLPVLMLVVVLAGSTACSDKKPLGKRDRKPPGASTIPKSQRLDMASFEKRIHVLINAERKERRRPLLNWDPALSQIARTHSRDMAARGYLQHTNFAGDGPVDRCRKSGYTIRNIPAGGGYSHLGCAENLFQATVLKSQKFVNGVLHSSEYYSKNELAALTVNGWMASSGHRSNILKDYWVSQGIGVAVSSGGQVYVTQLFN